MKAIVGIDGSEHAFLALQFAARLLRPEADQLHLYYACPKVHVSRHGTEKDEDRVREAVARGVFEEARRRLPEAWSADTFTISGKQRPQRGLIVAADNCRADLIVVGARGLGPLRGLLLGSVGRAVAHAATVPVLIVRGDEEHLRTVHPRVLLAYEGSRACERAANMICRFQWPPESRGYVMGVVESMFAGQVPPWLAEQARDATSDAMAHAWAEEQEQAKKEILETLRACQETLPGPFSAEEPILEEGNPAEKILGTIAARRIDLVVIGAHRQHTLGERLIGSTSEKILAHGNCSVLLVRDQEDP